MNLTRFFIIAIVGIVPMIIWKGTLEYALYPKVIVAFGACLIAYMSTIFKKSSASILSTHLPITVPLLLLWGACRIPFCINVTEALWDVSLLALGFSVLIISKLLREKDTILYDKSLIQVLLLSGAFTITKFGYDLYTQLYQAGLTFSKNYLFSVHVFSGNKNLAASCMFLMAIALFIVAQRPISTLYKKIGITIASLLILCSLLLQSKGVWIGCLILVIVYVPIRYRNKYITLSMVAVGLLLSCIVYIVFPQAMATLMDNERRVIWAKSWAMVIDHPWLGVGPGNFKTVFPSYGIYSDWYNALKDFYVVQLHPHNEYLDILCEHGIIGVCLFMGTLILVLYASYQKSKIDISNAFITAGICGFMVVMAVEFPLHRIEHICLWGIILSYVDLPNHAFFPRTLKWVNTSAIVLFVGSTVVACYRTKGSSHELAIQKAFQTNQWERMHVHILRAQNKFFDTDANSCPLDWYDAQYWIQTGDTQDALHALEKAQKVAPNYFQVTNDIGICYAKLGDFEKAESYFLSTIKINPWCKKAYLNLCLIYVQQKKFNEARRYLNQSKCLPEERLYIEQLMGNK